jgi:predicted transport protein
MYAQIRAQLERETGSTVEQWNARVREAGLGDEPEIRAWLGERGVAGYPAMLLVFEALGYPDYLQKGADELIDGQYRDRPAIRPIFDRAIEVLPLVGQVELQARKTYVALLSPKRTFASIQPTTKARVDIGLRLDGFEPGGRLEAAKSIGQSSMTHKIGLSSPAELDDEVVSWLRRAYEANV